MLFQHSAQSIEMLSDIVLELFAQEYRRAGEAKAVPTLVDNSHFSGRRERNKPFAEVKISQKADSQAFLRHGPLRAHSAHKSCRLCIKKPLMRSCWESSQFSSRLLF